MKLAVALFAVLVSVVSFFGFQQFKESKLLATVPPVSVTPSLIEESVGLPVHLKIPSIDVDAVVISVGLTPSGDMDTPRGPFEVAWFNLGQRPGDIGSAVITGHYGTWKNGGGSVFDKLHELNKGDKIYVQDENGKTIAFMVRESRSYNPTEDATNVFSSDDEKSHLNIITCEGVWSKDTKSFSQRLVVFADREE